MNTIVVYTDNVDGKLDNSRIDNFIFDCFTIVLSKNQKSEKGIIFDIATNSGNPNDCSCRVIMLNEESCEYEKATSFNWIVDGEKVSVVYHNIKDENVFGDTPCDWADYLYAVMSHIMTTKRDKITKEIISKDKANKKKDNKNVYGNKKVYLLDEIVEYVNNNGLTVLSNGTYKINCPCWSVRGHYRHYKNGRVVFVKSYEKGKEKGRTKPKNKVYYA